MTVILIDNYDSFTWNLAHQTARVTGVMPTVIRNNDKRLNNIQKLNPTAILISPGPGGPQESGLCLDILKTVSNTSIPVFGVCLGMQILSFHQGAKVISAPSVAHGKVSNIEHSNSIYFKGIPTVFKATRYHSLVVDPKSLKNDTCPYDVIATGPENTIMAISHKHYPWFGVQFHPESIESIHGDRILSNFFKQASLTSISN